MMETTESADRFMVAGFDLGHAGTAVATLWADSGEEPSIVTLHNLAGHSQVHPTAVARYVDTPGSAAVTIVGHPCFNLLEEHVPSLPDSIDPDPGAAAGKDMHLAFKSQDVSPGSRARYATELFVTRVIRQLTEPDLRPEKPGEFVAIPPGTRVHWVFGVPSGWKSATRNAYEELLRRVVTGLHPDHEVEVTPESRAAMLYSRSLSSGPQRGAGAQDPGSVLVIDMGSLTTDYTYVESYTGAKLREEPLDDGNPELGAALIDQLLMRRTIERHRDRDLLDRAVSDNYQRARLLFACRQAKERYFSLSAEGPVPDDAGLGHASIMTVTGEKIPVPVRVPSGLMNEILDTPLDEQARQGWRETLGSELAAVRTKILERYGTMPQTILLTGGASRMPFAQDMCRAAFAADAEPGRSLVIGQEPEYAIARGLAIAGRTRHRIDRFNAETATFTQVRVPALIKENLEPLATALGEIMFSGLVDQQLCPAILRWRRGEFERLNELGPEVIRAREEYIKGPQGSARQSQVIRDWYNEIIRVINQEAQLVANKYEVPSGNFGLPPLDAPGASPDADINAAAGLAALRVIANTAATIMTLITAWLTAFIIAVAAEAAAAAAAAAGAASATTPAGVVVIPIIVGGAVVGFIWRGKKVMLRKGMEKKLPLWMRKVGTENYILGRVRKKAAADQLEAKGAQSFAEKFVTEGGEQITSDISACVANQLTDAAERAALFIERHDFGIA